MEVSGHFHSLATLPTWKELPVPTEWETGWASEGLDALAKRENPCPCKESNAGHPTHSLVTILTAILAPFIT
jgi:hypothetical protein